MSSSLEGPLSWRTVVKSMITVQCGPTFDGGLAGRRPPARRILGLVYPTPKDPGGACYLVVHGT